MKLHPPASIDRFEWPMSKGFGPGDTIIIQGIPKDNTEFLIRILTKYEGDSEEEIPFEVRPQLSGSQEIIMHCSSKESELEMVAYLPEFPFKKGVEFTIRIFLDELIYKVYINGQYFDDLSLETHSESSAASQSRLVLAGDATFTCLEILIAEKDDAHTGMDPHWEEEDETSPAWVIRAEDDLDSKSLSDESTGADDNVETKQLTTASQISEQIEYNTEDGRVPVHVGEIETVHSGMTVNSECNEKPDENINGNSFGIGDDEKLNPGNIKDQSEDNEYTNNKSQQTVYEDEELMETVNEEIEQGGGSSAPSENDDDIIGKDDMEQDAFPKVSEVQNHETSLQGSENELYDEVHEVDCTVGRDIDEPDQQHVTFQEEEENECIIAENTVDTNYEPLVMERDGVQEEGYINSTEHLDGQNNEDDDSLIEERSESPQEVEVSTEEISNQEMKCETVETIAMPQVNNLESRLESDIIDNNTQVSFNSFEGPNITDISSQKNIEDDGLQNTFKINEKQVEAFDENSDEIITYDIEGADYHLLLKNNGTAYVQSGEKESVSSGPLESDVIEGTESYPEEKRDDVLTSEINVPVTKKDLTGGTDNPEVTLLDDGTEQAVRLRENVTPELEMPMQESDSYENVCSESVNTGTSHITCTALSPQVSDMTSNALSTTCADCTDLAKSAEETEESGLIDRINSDTTGLDIHVSRSQGECDDCEEGGDNAVTENEAEIAGGKTHRRSASYSSCDVTLMDDKNPNTYLTSTNSEPASNAITYCKVADVSDHIDTAKTNAADGAGRGAAEEKSDSKENDKISGEVLTESKKELQLDYKTNKKDSPEREEFDIDKIDIEPSVGDSKWDGKTVKECVDMAETDAEQTNVSDVCNRHSSSDEESSDVPIETQSVANGDALQPTNDDQSAPDGEDSAAEMTDVDLHLSTTSTETADSYDEFASMSVKLPHVRQLNGLHENRSILIEGTVNKKAKGFSVNIQSNDNCPPDTNVLMMFNPTLDDKKITSNSYLYESWGKADIKKNDFPFARGKKFAMLIVIRASQFEIYVNQTLCVEFKYRLPLEKAAYLRLDGDVFYFNVECPHELDLPREIEIPEGLKVGHSIHIDGFIWRKSRGFNLLIQNGSNTADDVSTGFKALVTFPGAITQLILNSYDNSRDGEEVVVDGNLPIARDKRLPLIIQVEEESFKIGIDENSLVTYDHCLPLDKLTNVILDGDMSLYAFSIERPHRRRLSTITRAKHMKGDCCEGCSIL